jgi:hypothetical protein
VVDEQNTRVKHWCNTNGERLHAWRKTCSSDDFTTKHSTWDANGPYLGLCTERLVIKRMVWPSKECFTKVLHRNERHVLHHVPTVSIIKFTYNRSYFNITIHSTALLSKYFNYVSHQGWLAYNDVPNICAVWLSSGASECSKTGWWFQLLTKCHY